MNSMLREPVRFGSVFTVIVMLSLLLLASMSSAVSAIGMAPAQETINHEPELTKTLHFRVLNPQGEAGKVLVYPKGPLAEHIEFDESVFVFAEGEKEKQLNYTLSLPEEMEEPGIHTTKIVAMELPEDADGSVVVADDSRVILQSGESETVVEATTAVALKLNVFVPYPGKYAEGKLIVEEAKVDEKVGFRIPLYSFGNKTIEDAEASIEIRGPTNEVIGKASTDPISIDPKQEKELMATWEASVHRGVYHAVARVEYDNKSFTLEKNFYVGNMRIEVLDVAVPQFNLGEIAKFEVTMKNKWNEKIKDVYAHMYVLDQAGQEFADFKTESFAIGADRKKTVDAFWDTEGVNPGSYDMRLDVHYADKLTEKRFNAKVNLDSIQTDVTPVAKAISKEGEGDQNVLLITVIIVLLGINIFWFIYFRKKSNSSKDGT